MGGKKERNRRLMSLSPVQRKDEREEGEAKERRRWDEAKRRIDARDGGARGRIALSGIFTGIRDGIVACPVPMQS